MKHLSNWIEIPVTDMDRAVKFYSDILGGIAFYQMEMQGMKYAIFPVEDKYNCGALVQGPYYKPSTDGVTIYLDGGADLNEILNRVKTAGASVIMEKSYMGEQAGYIGMFLDTEGNKIGLQNL